MSKEAPPGRAEVPEHVRRLLEGSVDAAVALDRERRILYYNQAYEHYAGLRPRDQRRIVASGRACHACFPIEVCQTACLVERAMATGRAVRMDEIRARRSDGEALVLIVTATPITEDVFVETYRDVTADARIQTKYKVLLDRERGAKERLEETVTDRTEALRRANAELKRAQARLIHTEKMSSLGRLVAGGAHQLNNPPNFVYGNVGFLAQYLEQLFGLVDLYDRLGGELTEGSRKEIAEHKERMDYDFVRGDAVKLLRSIRTGAERTASIVRDLKVFSRASPVNSEMQETDLVAGLEATVHLASPLFRDRIVLHREYAAGLPRVVCHAGQVNQVVMNLLDNAAQAISGQGDIWLQVALIDDGRRVRIEVTDSGPGIPEDILGQVFDPFFTTKEVGEGTGLGLAISESIARAHGGSIVVDNAGTEGRGARFRVELPLVPLPARKSKPPT